MTYHDRDHDRPLVFLRRPDDFYESGINLLGHSNSLDDYEYFSLK